MNKIITTALSFAFIITNFLGASAHGCYFYPPGKKFSVVDGTEDVFLFHDKVNAHLVVRTTLRAKKFPANFAWVLPLPSLPSKYEEIDGPFFQELSRLLPNQKEEGIKGQFGRPIESPAGSRSKAIQVHESVAMGQFVIQPIEILKDNSSAELNQWLKNNHFASSFHKNQGDYLKKGAAFLAIRVQMNSPSATELVSRPLHIVYKSEHLSFPLRYNHVGRTFDLNVYIFSEQELKKDLKSYYLERDFAAAYDNKRELPFVDAIIGNHKGFLTRYAGEKLNSNKKKLTELKEDPIFQ
jgi:hypothetical protein